MYLRYEGKDKYQFEHSDEKIGAIFSTHPLWRDKKMRKEQVKKLPNGYLIEDEAAESDEGGRFYLSYMDFQKTRHPIHALQTFVYAIDAGLNPPIAIQNFLAKAFHSFLDSEAQLSLNTTLGFKNNATSPRRFIVKQNLKDRDSGIVYLIAKLVYFFPQISLSKACDMVSESIANEIHSKNFRILCLVKKSARANISGDAVRKIFQNSKQKKRYNDYFRDEEEWGELDTGLEAKSAFLRYFTYISMPDELKQYHPDHKKSPEEKYLGS
ncbi:MAG: hypothetical protein R3B74_11665 [Nitrospirales bacterium]|nr:hypothetical protein [Nitrospirales bacterium]